MEEMGIGRGNAMKWYHNKTRIEAIYTYIYIYRYIKYIHIYNTLARKYISVLNVVIVRVVVNKGKIWENQKQTNPRNPRMETQQNHKTETETEKEVRKKLKNVE